MPDFEDLSIVGLDDQLSTRPDPNKGLYAMHLGLSGRPTADWQKCFDHQWNGPYAPRYNMWRRATATSTHIVITCVPEELDQYHLEPLKAAVKRTNDAYRALLQQQAQEAEKTAEAVRQEKERLAAVKGKLKFD